MPESKKAFESVNVLKLNIPKLAVLSVLARKDAMAGDVRLFLEEQGIEIKKAAYYASLEKLEELGLVKAEMLHERQNGVTINSKKLAITDLGALIVQGTQAIFQSTWHHDQMDFEP